MLISHPPAAGVPGFSLRQIEVRDANAWYDYLRLPEVIAHTSWNLQSANDLVPLIEYYRSEPPDTARRMVLIDDSTGQLVGSIGFHTVSLTNRNARLLTTLRRIYGAVASPPPYAAMSPPGRIANMTGCGSRPPH